MPNTALAGIEKIQLLMAEKSELRTQLIESDKSLHNTIFVFVSFFAAMFGIGIQNQISADLTAVLLLTISQIEFFLGLFSLALIVVRNTYVSYIRSIEARINLLAQDKISFFQSEVNSRFITNVKSYYFYIMLALILFVLVLFVYLMIGCASRFPDRSILKYILGFEGIVLLGLLAGFLRGGTSKHMYTFIHKHMIEHM